jgi:hypothetical protein
MRDLAMARLEQLAYGSTLRGLAPSGIAKVISVECFSPIEVLIRDGSDERYPFGDEEAEADHASRRWHVYRFEACRSDGLHFLVTRCLAFIDDDGKSWDYAELMNDAPARENPWRTEAQEARINEYGAHRANAMAIWDALPARNKAWLEEWFVLPYERVIDIDEHGDEWFDGPHVYVEEFDAERGPFRDYRRVKLATIGQWDSRQAAPDPEARIEKFVRREAKANDDPGRPEE